MITLGFRLAGLANVLGILFFSRVFTNDVLTREFPEVFSDFGIVAILLWGLAYLSVAKNPPRGISSVFAAEKAVYVATWIGWISGNGSRLGEIYAESPLAAVFLGGYGLNDLAFMILFVIAAIRAPVETRP